MRVLCERGAHPDPNDKMGQTPLSWAAEAGYDTFVDLLLQCNADLNSKDVFGHTPLWWATENGHEDTVNLLLEKGAVDAQAAGLDTGLLRPARQDNREPSEFDQWFSRKRYSRGCTTALRQDEYLDYLEKDFLNETAESFQSSSLPRAVDLCALWANLESQYTSLAGMAFDILSIPAMSAECERVFSSSKLLLDDRRNRMKEDSIMIEASECLRAWVLAEL
jgi:hAT family protein/ankyrin repeat protein